MAHASFKIIPGVDTTKTPALNEAAISQSQLIRFQPDRTLGGLVQKLGGWTKYPSATSPSTNSVTRALWAWGDINNNSYLAVGNEGSVSGGALQVVASGSFLDLTPTYFTQSVTVDFSTVFGSNRVTVKITGAGINQFDTIWLKTQVSVGGLILFDKYQVYNLSPASADSFYIYATDVLGNPQYATATVNNGGIVPQFTTTAASGNVTVTFPNHNYAAQETFPCLISTSVGGLIMNGNYEVYQVIDANNFVVINRNLATSATSAYMNGGNAYFYVYSGAGPQLFGSGYGVGAYGAGTYGYGSTITGITGTKLQAVDWTLENWGEDLIACPYGGSIYFWSPATNFPTAQVIPDAPPVNNGAFVAMPQRQIMAWGSSYTGISDPMQIRWSDVGTINVWKPNITNQAGGYRIPRGSRIVQGLQGPQQALFWTDLGLWAGQYIGPTDVYGFNELATGCGLIGRKAAGVVNGVAYWMGQSQLFEYGGGGSPTPIVCPIWDVVFQELDRNYVDNIRFSGNSRFGEVAWYFPINGSGGVPTNYIKYNYLLRQWDYGILTRTAWINESVLGPPIGATFLDESGKSFLVQHETSNDAVNANGQPIAMDTYFETGFFVLSEADVKMFIDQIWPDMKWSLYNGTQSANVLLTFYVADYAGQTPTEYGPFTVTQATTFVTPRFRGRLVSIKIESNDIGSFWRLGNIRYRVQPDGRF